MEPQTARLAQFFADLTAAKTLSCRKPLIAAHQFMGLLNEFSLWPWMMSQTAIPVSDENIIDGAVRMFLGHYKQSNPKGKIVGAKPKVRAPRPPR